MSGAPGFLESGMPPQESLTTAVIGGGPAGLMAAEVLAAAGHAVTVFDAKPSVGRKFLLAGKGGLNLTHSEPFEPFLGRFGMRAPHLEPLLPGSSWLSWRIQAGSIWPSGAGRDEIRASICRAAVLPCASASRYSRMASA